jgi:hypothetical protein
MSIDDLGWISQINNKNFPGRFKINLFVPEGFLSFHGGNTWSGSGHELWFRVRT